MKPKDFWGRTLNENSLIALYKNNEDLQVLRRQRNLEFYMHRTVFAGMAGVQVYGKIYKKPQDLYPLEGDNKLFEPVKIDVEQQRKTLDWVKKSKSFNKWHKKN